MPERPRTDGDHSPGGARSSRRVLIAATSEPVAVTYGALLGTQGIETILCPLTKLGRALAGDAPAECVLVVGTGDDRDAALDQVRAMRASDSEQVRRTAVVLLVSEGHDEVQERAAGADGVVVLPAHLTAIVAAIDDVPVRPRDEAGQSFSKFSQ